MNKGMIWLSAIAFSLSVNTATVFALPADNMKKCPGHEYKEKMLEKLNLTDAQKKQIEDIKKQYKEGMRAKFGELKNLRSQMIDLVKSDKIDENQLNQLVNQKKEILGSILKSKIMMKNQIYNVLNDDQKKQYIDMMQKWMDKKMMHMQKMDKKDQTESNEGVNLMDEDDTNDTDSE
ncbi:hypothetical protein FOG18_08630 [Legionella israelensis]|uniref:Spy/CpxP family protein refolding chaperone n=1 Tax=Legionella israelensis TaxID=454 RepID=UPI00117C877E|nr:Spy/CpxP family protein refolding chaperone [Legionella israelensis]QDP72613.1 hypothetical protein FOG18_08630 [Legionella israelensis]